jgi:serine/threonine protein kinase
VPIFEASTWNGQDYIAMPLLEGKNLAQSKVDRRTALTYIRDAARALHFAHEKGIVHRDIKPSNLMLDESGRVYVADFGIARQSVATASMTTPGTVVGTPAYMSPEQAMGLPVDARSDVYSLGATLYELLTGKPPFDGEPLAVIEAVRTREPETARRLVQNLSKNVDAILTGAMERRPQDRYPTAAALAEDIDRYLEGERPMRRPRGLSYRVQREFVRHPWRSGATIVLGLLLVLAGVLLGYFIRAWTYREKAKQTSDRTLKMRFLVIAAPFFADADSRARG